MTNLTTRPKRTAAKPTKAVFQPPKGLAPPLPRKPAASAVSALGRMATAKRALLESQLKVDAILCEGAELRAQGLLTKTDFDKLLARTAAHHVQAAAVFGAIR